jgi:hypothetical protein
MDPASDRLRARDAFVARLNQVSAHARTRDGRTVTVLHERQDDVLVTTCAFHGGPGEVVTIEQASSPFWPDHSPPERLDAFLLGLRRASAAFDRAWVASGDLLPLALLDVRSLVTADDFARALLEPGRRLAAFGELFGEDLAQRAGLPELPIDDAILLHRLDAGDGLGAELMAIANEVGRTPELRPYAIELLELWAGRGFLSDLEVPAGDPRRIAPRIAERLFVLVERRAKGAERARLARIGDRLELHGLLLPASLRPTGLAVG